MPEVKGCEVKEQRPPLELVGQDGNAFFILGRAKGAMRKAGWPAELQEKVMAEAMSGDYDHLLRTMMEYFDVD